MRKMKFALIGAGRWGKIYIQTISRLANMEISLLCTSNLENRKLVDSNCHICSDWRDILTKRNIDALILAVPPSIQFEILLANLKSKIPLILEKPLTIDAKQAKEIKSLYSKENIISLVDHIYLFHPAYTTLKKNLHLIGNIKSIKTEGGSFGPFRHHTPPLWDYGPHDLSMCLDIIKDYPNKITTTRISRQKNKETLEEVWEVNLQFSSGIQTKSIIGNGMKKKTRKIEVIGEEGSLIFDDFDKDKLNLKKNFEISKILIPNESKLPLDIAIETFVDAIRGKHDSRLGLTLGSDIVTILEECYLNN